jgi:large subunit ribosomal protein L9
MTQIVLTQDIYKLGSVGDVVNVKAGYARNFLIPHGKALVANKANLEFFEIRKAELKEKSKQEKESALVLSKKIDGRVFDYIAAASERGMLYGAVTPTVVASLLEEHDIHVNKLAIQIQKPIKTLGIHDIRIVLHSDILAVVKFNIATNKEVAQEQLREAQKLQQPAIQDDLDALNLKKE